MYYIGFPEKSLFSNIGERRSSKTDMGFDIELHEEEVPDLPRDCRYTLGQEMRGKVMEIIILIKTESQDNSWDAGDAPGSPGVCASDVRP